jgi:hypothetical protein
MYVIKRFWEFIEYPFIEILHILMSVIFAFGILGVVSFIVIIIELIFGI